MVGFVRTDSLAKPANPEHEHHILQSHNAVMPKFTHPVQVRCCHANDANGGKNDRDAVRFCASHRVAGAADDGARDDSSCAAVAEW